MKNLLAQSGRPASLMRMRLFMRRKKVIWEAKRKIWVGAAQV